MSSNCIWAIGKHRFFRPNFFLSIWGLLNWAFFCSFGILPTMEKLYHRGVMRTKCDDCQFVCITQTDYYRIQHQGEENTKRHEENGRLVMVTEQRGGTDVPSRRGHIVIRVSKQNIWHLKLTKFTCDSVVGGCVALVILSDHWYHNPDQTLNLDVGIEHTAF